MKLYPEEKGQFWAVYHPFVGLMVLKLSPSKNDRIRAEDTKNGQFYKFGPLQLDFYFIAPARG